MKEKLLLDTDIGSDIDDAVCLAYLLAEPRCDLLGVTTVSGEPDRRAQIVEAICRAAGREVPIYPGAERPFIGKQKQPHSPQSDVLKGDVLNATYPQGEYLEFMRDTIRRNPGEVTLLAIGPLTNIGLLFTMDPELPSLLKQLVLMCGRFTERSNSTYVLEWNALCDPHATAMVYRAAAPKHISYGLDVTSHVTMPAEQVRERFKGPVLGLVAELAEVWFAHRPVITFHDPLAAASIFEPEICEYETGQVDIELTSERLWGLTHWRQQDGGPHQIATKVNADRFFARYFAPFA